MKPRNNPMWEAIIAVTKAMVREFLIEAHSSQKISLPIDEVPNGYSYDGGLSLGTTYQVLVLVGENGDIANPSTN
ncbi:MAG: hypothetical protein N3E44_01695, partial [Candidatus Bathyarchaeota archaeon]|nr:hypothetical protein [Candidatus Bathyarchaeota archaeon]